MAPEMSDSLNEIKEIYGIFREPTLARLESLGMLRKCYKGE
jgi:hypothetical protein